MAVAVRSILVLGAVGLMFLPACEAGGNGGADSASDSWLDGVEVQEISEVSVEACRGMGPAATVLKSDEFSAIVDARILPDGRIAVADYRAGSVMILSGSGLQKVIGGAGEGPGEFRRLRGLALSGDTVLAWDNSLRRVTAVTPEGEVLWTEQLVTDFPGSWGGDFHGRSASGHYPFIGTPRVLMSPGSQYRDTATYLGVSPGEGKVLEGVRVPSTYQSTFREGRGMRTMPQIFSPEAHLAVAAGFSWIGESASGLLVRLDGSGWPERGLRISPHTISLTQDLIDKERQVLRSLGPGSTPTAFFDVATEIPAFGVLPVFDRIQGTSEGDVWISEYITRDADSRRHWVIDSAGQYVGCVVTKPGFRVMDARNGHLLLMDRDSLDVPFLAIHDYPEGWR